jgi:multiple sugar transport system permease protein
MNQSSTFAGLANYVAIFSSKDFFQSLRNTLLFALYRVPTIIFLALIIAMLLKHIRFLKGFFRILFFIPYVTSSVAISWVFRFMYLPNFGIFTPIFDFLKIPRQDFLGTPNTALIAIVVVTVWSSVGLYILLFLAGLEDIPSELYDAAMVDGANPWQRFKFITMPLLNRTIVLNTTLCLVNSLQTFTYVRMLSADNGMGGPLGATRTLPILIYKEAFYSLKMGRASAISFVFFLIILAFSLAQRRIMTREID